MVISQSKYSEINYPNIVETTFNIPTHMKPIYFSVAIAILMSGCGPQKPQTEETSNEEASKPQVVERLDSAINKLIDKDAKLEILGEGYTWAEGPVWVPSQQMVLFTDVPNNVAYKWKEGEGVSVFLKPSGYTAEAGKEEREPGANGLILDDQGRLLLCQHGDRRVARMDAPLDAPASKFVTLVDRFEGKRLNSPNDLILSSWGDIYFTDPPYGLTGLDASPIKEIPFNGVYRLKKSGEIELVTDKMSKPNGIALSPDEKTLYVANSDPERSIWMAFPVNEDGSVGEGKVFFDATELTKVTPGNPDGMKVDSKGNIFATGPGGVVVLSPSGKHLGTIITGAPTANIAFAGDDKVVFITSESRLLRMKLRD
jgi:gluconolactonase